MFIDQPIFILLPLVIFYYILPVFLGYYLGRSEKSPVNLLLPIIIIGLFYLVRPYEISGRMYFLSIIIPSLTLLFMGYLFGILKRKIIKNSSIPYIIGITGLPCSGKSEAAGIFGKLGAKVIDVDRLGHICLKDEDTIDELTAIFGIDILTAEKDAGKTKEIDRTALGRIVFNSPKNLEILENILHPLMVAKIEEEIKFLEPEAVMVLDAAILHHMKLDKICKKVYLTYTDRAIREVRANTRGWDSAELTKRDQAVLKSLKLSNINLILNNHSRESFIKNIETIWKEIINER